MYNLALAYSGQGKHPEAEELHRETAKIQRWVLGEEDPTRSSR